MTAEAMLNAALLAYPSLTAVVPAERIASDYVAQELGLPSIVTTRAGTEYTNTIHGAPPVASDVTMDIWCMDQQRGLVEQVADLVEVAVADGGFRVINRRHEFEIETMTYSTIVSCIVPQ